MAGWEGGVPPRDSSQGWQVNCTNFWWRSAMVTGPLKRQDTYKDSILCSERNISVSLSYNNNNWNSKRGHLYSILDPALSSFRATQWQNFFNITSKNAEVYQREGCYFNTSIQKPSIIANFFYLDPSREFWTESLAWLFSLSPEPTSPSGTLSSLDKTGRGSESTGSGAEKSKYRTSIGDSQWSIITIIKSAEERIINSCNS